VVLLDIAISGRGKNNPKNPEFLQRRFRIEEWKYFGTYENEGGRRGQGVWIRKNCV
jgi:hypothetical protein